MAPELVVMAAGLGSRFGGPKQLAQVGPSGERIIDYSLFDAARAGVRRVVFVIRRELEDELREIFERGACQKLDIAYAFQEMGDIPSGFTVPLDRKKPWGTAHAVYAARAAVSGAFLLINADDFYGFESFRIAGAHSATVLAEPGVAALVAFRLKNTLSEHGAVSRGVCEVDREGILLGIRERARLTTDGQGAVSGYEAGRVLRFTGDELVSMNFWAFGADIFPYLGRELERFFQADPAPNAELGLPFVMDALIRTGELRVRVLESSETWFGVTHPEDRLGVSERIENLVAAGVYPSALWG